MGNQCPLNTNLTSGLYHTVTGLQRECGRGRPESMTRSLTFEIMSFPTNTGCRRKKVVSQEAGGVPAEPLAVHVALGKSIMLSLNVGNLSSPEKHGAHLSYPQGH